MCSWCYGFSPQLDSVLKTFPELPLSLIVGGLRPEGKETFDELSSFLHEHWSEIQLKTGRPFRYEILNSKELLYNTEPACRAVVVVKTISPDKAYPFFKALQSAFYEENRNPTLPETFYFVADQLGIDRGKFEKHFNSPVIQHETVRDFQLAQTLQVHGFPSLIALINGKLHRISTGYTNADEIIKNLISSGHQGSSR